MLEPDVCVTIPEGGVNFDIGRETTLGNLNDIYGRSLQLSKQRYLPTRTFRSSFSSDDTDISRYMLSLRLKLITRPETYGLAIWNPELIESMPEKKDVKYISAFSEAFVFFNEIAWMSSNVGISSRHRESLLIIGGIDGQPQTTSLGVNEEPSANKTRFFVIPQYLALPIFGTTIYAPFTPNGLDVYTIDNDAYVSERQSFFGTNFFDRMKSLSKLVSNLHCAEVLDDKLITKPLVSTLTMRSTPIDQLAIVSSTCLQLRRSIEEPNNQDTINHPSRGILCLPCGIGKTNIAIATWLGVGDERYSILDTPNFGFVTHGSDHPSFEKWKLSFLKNSSAKESGVDNPYDLRERLHRAPRMLWVVKGLTLVDQCISRIKLVVPRASIGRLQASSRPNPIEFDCVVASLDTIVSQEFDKSYFSNFGMVIVDEAHLVLSTVAKCIFEKIGGIPLGLFLTATPRKQELRWFGGPILVSASRPHTTQSHIAIYRTGVDTRDRQPAISHIYKQDGNRRQNNSEFDLGTTDICIAYNMARNAFICDTIAHIMWRRNDTFDMRHSVYRLETTSISNNFWSSVSNDQWTQIMNIIYRRGCLSDFATTMYTKLVPFNVINAGLGEANCGKNNLRDCPLPSLFSTQQSVFKSVQQVSSIVDDTYDEDVRPRVPIIFSKYVSHTIIMQHMLAQKWMDDYRLKKGGNPRVLLIRTGLRQLAVIDLDVIEKKSPDLFSKIVWLNFMDDTVTTPHGKPQKEQHPRRPPIPQQGDFMEIFAKNGWHYSGIHKPEAEGVSATFDQKFFENWVKRYTPSTGFATQIGSRNIFYKSKQKNNDVQQPKSTGTVKTPKQPAKWDASDWTQYAQYFWTPVYWPLPMTKRRGVFKKKSVTKKDIPNTDQDYTSTQSNEKKRKLKTPSVDDEDTHVEGSKRCKISEEDSFIDTDEDDGFEFSDDDRPNIFAIEGAVLATFGLIVGKSNKFPSNLLFTPNKCGLRTFNSAHFNEALNSDYIFANYQAASTGLDHDRIDTTIDVHPGGSDDEQRKGRGMREAPNKQPTLHIQFPESFSIYGSISKKHLTSFEAQNVKTKLYVVDIGRQCQQEEYPMV